MNNDEEYKIFCGMQEVYKKEDDELAKKLVGKTKFERLKIVLNHDNVNLYKKQITKDGERYNYVVDDDEEDGLYKTLKGIENDMDDILNGQELYY